MPEYWLPHLLSIRVRSSIGQHDITKGAAGRVPEG